MKRLLARLGMAAAAAMQPDVAAAQCAMCRQALLSPEGQQLAGALRGGVLVLLVVPFAVFGVIACLALRGAVRARGAGHDPF